MENPHGGNLGPRMLALVAGPICGWLMFTGMSVWSEAPYAACVTGGIAIWMAVWWMTEAIPLAATALIPIISFPFAAVYQSE